jgi:arginine exporter protein ArgO
VAIPLDEMTRGVAQPEVLVLVQAGMMNRCYLAYAVTTGTAPLPAKRKMLCSWVNADPPRYLLSFAWMSLAQANISTLDSYDATVATSTINQTNWDMMADLLVPDSAVA